MHKTITAIFAALAVLPLSARAIPITGDMIIYGQFTPILSDGSAATLGTATGLDFLGDEFVVETATGTFAKEGIYKGDTGTINDFFFNPLSPAPVSPLWAIGGFEFALYSVSVDVQTDAVLTLSGTGWLTGNGYDSTFGYWSFDGGHAPGRFFFGSSTSATVPEPASLLLFGGSLLCAGLGVALRRRRTSAL